MNIALVGVGMGTPAAMTVEARDAIAAADAVIGSERLLTGLSGLWSDRKIITLALAHPEAIANAVGARPEWRSMCVLLSGDVGFHSGAKRLVELLSGHELRLVPGVSAPQYFAARLRRPWQDFRLVSAHGVACDIVAEALNHPAVLFLTGGAATPRRIAMTLCDAGLGEAAMTVGENLSGPDERITNADAARVAFTDETMPPPARAISS